MSSTSSFFAAVRTQSGKSTAHRVTIVSLLENEAHLVSSCTALVATKAA